MGAEHSHHCHAHQPSRAGQGVCGCVCVGVGVGVWVCVCVCVCTSVRTCTSLDVILGFFGSLEKYLSNGVIKQTYNYLRDKLMMAEK